MAEIKLSSEELGMLEKLALEAESGPVRRRAAILLRLNSRWDIGRIADEARLSRRTVRYWRREFMNRGMEIFGDALRGEPALGEPDSQISKVEQIEEDVSGHLPEADTSIRKSAPQGIRFPAVRKKPGLKASDPMPEAGRKILRFHFARMLRHEKGTRLGEDIEELHDMRVATRRMRAAFEVFGDYYKPKVVKAHLKGLRATGRALGRVRDLDVFMEKAQIFIDSLPEGEKDGLEPLLTSWRQEQSVERDKMVAYLDSDRYQSFKGSFNEFVSTAGEGVPSQNGNGFEPAPVRYIAPILIYTHLASVRNFSAIVSNAAIEQLHALRIEFKKLRYTLEFFSEVLGEHAGEVVQDIKTLQDHLGDLNDADVACRILREFIESWEDRQIDLPLQERRNPEPVVAYLATKHAERHRLMVTFPEAWDRFNRPELLRNIALAVSVL